MNAPFDVWLKISELLEDQADRAACCLISRNVYPAAREALWQRVALTGSGLTNSPNLQAFLSAANPDLRLRELRLVDIVVHDLRDLNRALCRVQRAKKVVLQRAVLNDTTLANADEALEGSLRQLFARLAPTEVHLLDSAFLWSFLTHLPHLQHVTVDNSDVSDASIDPASKHFSLPSVTTCRLVALDQFSSVYFFFLSFLPGLQELSLYIQDINAPREAINRCPPSLKHLRLDCGSHMNFFSGLGGLLGALTRRCGQLESLTLVNLSFEKFYKQQWVLPPSLHTLHLICCEDVGLSWMRLLMPRMPGLKTFHVSILETDLETETRLETEWQAVELFAQQGVSVHVDLIKSMPKRHSADSYSVTGSLISSSSVGSAPPLSVIQQRKAC